MKSKNIKENEIEKEIFEERIKLIRDAWSEGRKKGSLSKQKDVLKIIDEIENPYPEDVFPELTKTDLEYLNYIFNKSHLALDRVSACLMRRARETLKEELKQKIGEIK